MRGSIGRLAIGSSNCTKQALFSCSPFSTFSGAGGDGRGRGRGSNFPNPQFNHQTPGKPVSEEDVDAASVFPSGLGHGRGKPMASNPARGPSFSSPGANPSIGQSGNAQPPPNLPPQDSQSGVNPPTGRGRSFQPPHGFQSTGRGGTTQSPPNLHSQDSPSGVYPPAGRGRTFQHPQESQSGISQSAGRGQPMQRPSIPTPQGTQSGVGTPVVPNQNVEDTPVPPPQEFSQSEKPKMPIFFSREDTSKPLPMHQNQEDVLEPLLMQEDSSKPLPTYQKQEDATVQPSLHPGLVGSGRGKPLKGSVAAEKPVEVNRHIGRRLSANTEGTPSETASQRQPLNQEDAAKAAIEVLSRGGGGGGRTGGRGRGGRGFRGRGRGGRGRGRSGDLDDDDSICGLHLGDNADGEKLAEKLGPEKMALLNEAFEEMSSRVLPSPAEDAYWDAVHTNNMIEFEPEYAVEFDNPDIDEKPPMSLRDALEKMKPFLMVYEGIQSQEEWEKIIEDLMKKVPAMKELIDHYSGPDRVTAKQQQQELQRVAKTLPENVPSSVKRYTDRAVLSLQSNPGWGWDKKCQFMDKLVAEFSQHYK